MPKRCGCSDTCTCLIEAGTGIAVVGIGTTERPYEISSVLTMADLADVNDPDGEPAPGEVPVWMGTHWEFRPQTGGGGGGALPPGGTLGEVLTKASAVDGDATWETLLLDEVLVANSLPGVDTGLELWVDTDAATPISGSQVVQSGIVSITPSAANTPTSAPVVLSIPYASSTSYVVVACAYSSVPGSTVLGVSTFSRTATGFDVILTRTNTTSTAIMWIAVGTVA